VLFFIKGSFRFFGGRPKIAKPPEPEPIPVPPPAPMPVEAEEMGEAKKGVRRRAKKSAGRTSTILAGRMMAERSNGILSDTLGQNYGS